MKGIDSRIEDAIYSLKKDPLIRSGGLSIRVQPPRSARVTEIDILSEPLKRGLIRLGIKNLFLHQAEAINNILSGKNTTISTPTASGKTICYNVPVLETLSQKKRSKALYMFPTKALSQDQREAFYRLRNACELDALCDIYDGDTPQEKRRRIREGCDVVITNPDMLHRAILPHHPKWAKFFADLDYVVIDEIHTYTGIFGSHLANLIRRLKRIARFYSSNPIFVTCSATIGNPKEISENIVEAEFVLVDKNGAPEGARVYAFFMPPIVDSVTGIRASYLVCARRCARILVEGGLKGIVFVNSRLNVEVLTRSLKEEFEKRGLDPERIRGYRGGYLPESRREIERAMRDNDIDCIVSTNALELGIDIGSLDFSIAAGFPDSISSLFQRFGRAGRRRSGALCLLIARSDPLDQFMVHQNDYLFKKGPEIALVDPDNIYVLMDHIRCAVFELPFRQNETFGRLDIEDTHALLDHLSEGRVVHRQDNTWYWVGDRYPAEKVDLRNIPGVNYVVCVQSHNGKRRVIGEVDYTSAMNTIYEGAIYLVQGETHIITKIDHRERIAYAEKEDTDYFTDAIVNSRIEVLSIDNKNDRDNLLLELGDVSVYSEASGYKKIRFDTRENVGYGEIDWPAIEYHTRSLILTFRPALFEGAGLSLAEILDCLERYRSTLHAAFCQIAMCARQDIGSVLQDRRLSWRLINTPSSRVVTGISASALLRDDVDEFEPAIFIYDAYTGGVGLADGVYPLAAKVAEVATKMITGCDCQDGCPSCIGPLLQDTKLTFSEDGPLSGVFVKNEGLKKRVSTIAELVESGIKGE